MNLTDTNQLQILQQLDSRNTSLFTYMIILHDNSFLHYHDYHIKSIVLSDYVSDPCLAILTPEPCMT